MARGARKRVEALLCSGKRYIERTCCKADPTTDVTTRLVSRRTAFARRDHGLAVEAAQIRRQEVTDGIVLPDVEARAGPQALPNVQ